MPSSSSSYSHIHRSKVWQSGDFSDTHWPHTWCWGKNRRACPTVDRVYINLMVILYVKSTSKALNVSTNIYIDPALETHNIIPQDSLFINIIVVIGYRGVPRWEMLLRHSAFVGRLRTTEISWRQLRNPRFKTGLMSLHVAIWLSSHSLGVRVRSTIIVFCRW